MSRIIPLRLLVAIMIPLLLGQHAIRGVDGPMLGRDGAKAGCWPQWRGPDRQNRSGDVGLLQKWPEGGPPLSWRVDGLGDGIASIALADGRAFTSTTYGENEFAVALDEETGQRLWATRIAAAVPEQPLMRWLSQRAPTVDGDRLYVFTNNGWLLCLNSITGDIVWRISYPSEFGTPPGNWGFCDRPLVDGEKLICAPGGTQATVVALDKRTGKVLWKKLLDTRERNQYAATLLVETGGLKQYVAFLTQGLASFAADDGRLLWRYYRRYNLANSYTPLIVKGGLLSPNGYGSGIARLKLTRRDNSVTAEEQYYKAMPLDPFEDSSMLVDGRLYAFRGGGIVMCIDSSDGKVLWTVRGNGGKVAGTYADGRLYLRWSNGAVALVECSPKEYIEAGRFKLFEPRDSIGCTLPVVAGGHLYVRDNDRLYCFDVRQHPADALPRKPAVVEWTPATYTDPEPEARRTHRQRDLCPDSARRGREDARRREYRQRRRRVRPGQRRRADRDRGCEEVSLQGDWPGDRPGPGDSLPRADQAVQSREAGHHPAHGPLHRGFQ